MPLSQDEIYTILETACNKGLIVKVLEEHGYKASHHSDGNWFLEDDFAKALEALSENYFKAQF